MKQFSNRYMLLYALGLAAVVAVLLTVVATSLHNRQQTNLRNEKMLSLLTTIGISSDADHAAEDYQHYFTEELTIGVDGTVLSRYSVAEDKMTEGDMRAFNINLKEQQKLEKEGGKGAFPLYLYEIDGKHGYVIPTQGNGLWGPVYANLALADDFNTIVGATFSHDSETPGLGAEIAAEPFCRSFAGKKILDDEGHVASVAVVKHADPANAHQVDAISGGTMTSNGVSAMLSEDLARYQKYIETVRFQNEAETTVPCDATSDTSVQQQ